MDEIPSNYESTKRQHDAIAAFLDGLAYRIFEADRKEELASVEADILEGNVTLAKGQTEDWMLRGERRCLQRLEFYFQGVRDNLNAELEEFFQVKETDAGNNEQDSENETETEIQ